MRHVTDARETKLPNVLIVKLVFVGFIPNQ